MALDKLDIQLTVCLDTQKTNMDFAHKATRSQGWLMLAWLLKAKTR